MTNKAKAKAEIEAEIEAIRLQKLTRARRIYETWRRLARTGDASSHFHRYGDALNAILWEMSDTYGAIDVTAPPSVTCEIVKFTLDDDGYIICEDQVVSNIRHWR